jgi:hypothetical protein
MKSLKEVVSIQNIFNMPNDLEEPSPPAMDDQVLPASENSSITNEKTLDHRLASSLA